MEIPEEPFAFILHVTKPHWRFAVLALSFAALAQTLKLVTIYAISQLIDNFSTLPFPIIERYKW